MHKTKAYSTRKRLEARAQVQTHPTIVCLATAMQQRLFFTELLSVQSRQNFAASKLILCNNGAGPAWRVSAFQASRCSIRTAVYIEMKIM